jgi:hypothetical protein
MEGEKKKKGGMWKIIAHGSNTRSYVPCSLNGATEPTSYGNLS